MIVTIKENSIFLNQHVQTTQTCGQSARPASSDRRMSIFGVSLRGHLELQHRNVPLILESTVDELQKRGMRVKVSALSSFLCELSSWPLFLLHHMIYLRISAMRTYCTLDCRMTSESNYNDEAWEMTLFEEVLFPEIKEWPRYVRDYDGLDERSR